MYMMRHWALQQTSNTPPQPVHHHQQHKKRGNNKSWKISATKAANNPGNDEENGNMKDTCGNESPRQTLAPPESDIRLKE